MKKNFLSALIALIASSATLAFGTTAIYTNIIMADTPVAFWPLNETSGTVVHDIAGTNTGTIIHPAGVGMGLPGILYSGGVNSDTGFYFTNNAVGGGGYISVPYSTNFNTPIFSVEAWLNMPTFPATGAGVNMCAISLDNSTGYGWVFNIASANASNPALSGWCGPGSGWTVVSGGVAIQSKWSFYAMTYDGATFSVYTNGVLAGSHSSSYRQVNAGNPLLIGTYINGGTADGSRYYRGGMENVAVFDYTLNSAQVAKHYSYGTNSGSVFINTQPASQTNYMGLNASFNVAVTGLPPLVYQWMAGATGSGVYTNLVPNDQITDVTNTTLNISSLTLDNAADYVVVVTNTFGSATSSVARLTILTNLTPSVVSQPITIQTNYVGKTASMSVAATGYPTLYYQWMMGARGSGSYTNLLVSGQMGTVTASTLSISALTGGNAGDYVVVITNAYGAVTSSISTLVVQTNTVSTNTIKLMCIGDSITHIDTCYWRVDLASNLVNDGFNFIMVGRAEGALGYPTQRHHEGYDGITTWGILAQIPAMMAANVPDIAMIHLGANDLSADAPNKTVDFLRQIIWGLQAANSNMTIVVSQIIPNNPGGGQTFEYNYLIPQMCLQQQTASSHIVVADVFSGFDLTVGFDNGLGPHPNAAGGRFMCNVYTPIIESIMNGHIPDNPPLLDPWAGPPGFTLASFANSSSPYALNFPTPVTVAWGRITNLVYQKQNFVFKSNVSGAFTFNNNLGDPAPGYEKFGFVQHPAPILVSMNMTPEKTMQLQYTGAQTNQAYTLQVATDMSAFRQTTTVLATNNFTHRNMFPIPPAGWTSISSIYTTNNTSFTIVDPNPGGNLGYYRIYEGPFMTNSWKMH